MRRQNPSIRNPYYPLAYRIFLSLSHPSIPWKAADLPFKLLNHQITCLQSHGFIISRGRQEGKGQTLAHLWVFNPPVIENLRFLVDRQNCTHVKREDSLFGKVFCRRLKHQMSINGCRECIKFKDLPEEKYKQSFLQMWGLILPFL
jgi:hypothetical protein